MINRLKDFNKDKRISMWWACVIFTISIPLFNYFDGKQLNESDLIVVENLILSEDSKYEGGGSKSGSSSIRLKFIKTERFFKISNEEYQCVSNKEILKNFKRGDTISIKLMKGDENDFFKTTWFNKFTKLYGLSKKGREYLFLICRNEILSKTTNAATIASIIAAVLSFIFALFFLKPKNKYQAFSQFSVHPIFVVSIAWLIVYISLR